MVSSEKTIAHSVPSYNIFVANGLIFMMPHTHFNNNEM